MADDLKDLSKLVATTAKETQSSIRDLTTEIHEVVVLLKASVSANANGGAKQWVSLPMVFVIVGALTTNIALTIGFMNSNVATHVANHRLEMAEVRESTAWQLAEIDEWERAHDRRVLPLNTAQSTLIDVHSGLLRSLWSKIIPGLAFPNLPEAPRLD